MRHLSPLAVKQASAPSTPASGDNLIYPKSDGFWYTKDSSGVERQVDTADGTQTLTNKTLTSPNVNQLDDTNGVKAWEITPTASAVNFGRIVNNVAGQPPAIGVGGTDTNISLNLFGKGTGVILLNGLAAVDVSSTQTLSGKTLTDPKINHAMRGFSHVTAGSFTTSAATELTLATVTVTCDGTTPVEVQFTWYNFVKTVAGDTFLWKLYDGATQIAQALSENTAVVNTAAKPLRTVLTPTAGSHSFTAKIVRNTGTGTAQAAPTTSAPFDLTVTPWF